MYYLKKSSISLTFSHAPNHSPTLPRSSVRCTGNLSSRCSAEERRYYRLGVASDLRILASTSTRAELLIRRVHVPAGRRPTFTSRKSHIATHASPPSSPNRMSDAGDSLLLPERGRRKQGSGCSHGREGAGKVASPGWRRPCGPLRVKAVNTDSMQE